MKLKGLQALHYIRTEHYHYSTLLSRYLKKKKKKIKKYPVECDSSKVANGIKCLISLTIFRRSIQI
jgi:hypothetical protein